MFRLCCRLAHAANILSRVNSRLSINVRRHEPARNVFMASGKNADVNAAGAHEPVETTQSSDRSEQKQGRIA
jgi:hypothetical protein